MMTDAETLFSLLNIPPPTEPVDFEERGAAYLAEALARRNREYWEKHTPPKYREFNPNHANLRPNADKIAKALAWQFSPLGLLLSGPTNLGKTRTLCALTRRLLCEENRDVAIFTAHEFFAELGNCVNYGQDDASGFIKRMSERPIFFMDDFGQEALLKTREDWAQQWFHRFLELRRGLGLPLLITMNLTAEQIAGNRGSIHGDPLITRLLDVAEPIKFKSAS